MATFQYSWSPLPIVATIGVQATVVNATPASTPYFIWVKLLGLVCPSFQVVQRCWNILFCGCFSTVLLLSPTQVNSQERGRVSLDYMSLVVPANWEVDVYSGSISFTSPDRIDTSYVRCVITINAAGPVSEGPTELLAAADRGTPGNLQREQAKPISNLSNGWNITNRIYRNRYVPSIYYRAVVMTRGGVGQVLRVANDLSRCSVDTEEVLNTLKISEKPMRFLASGAPLNLLPVPVQDNTGEGKQRTGTVCMAAGITCLNSGPVGSSCMCASTKGLVLGSVQ